MRARVSELTMALLRSALETVIGDTPAIRPRSAMVSRPAFDFRAPFRDRFAIARTIRLARRVPGGVRRVRIGYRQVDGAPQLRRVGFVGVGGGCAEGRDVEALSRKTPGPKLGVAHGVRRADCDPE